MGAPSRRLLDAILQLVTTADWLSEADVEAANTDRDRGRTARLLAMLRDPRLPGGLRRSTVAALAWIDDPRAYGPLSEIILDARLDEAVREAASAVFSKAICAPAVDVERWWTRRHDATLERIAIAHMTRAHEELVLGLLAEPSHPAYAEVIATLASGFDHPRFVEHAVSALYHVDARVRRAGIEAVLFSAPTAAIAPLLLLLDDENEEVAAEALEMLTWYDDSREMLLGVAAFAERTSNAALCERASEIVECVGEVVAIAFARRSPDERALLRAWLAPVWSLVSGAIERTVAAPERSEPPPPVPERRTFAWSASVDAFCERFGDTDQPFRPLEHELALCDWDAVHGGARPALGDALLAWPDPAVRCHAARAFAAWRDYGRMLELLDDPTPAVAASASYHAHELGPHPALAARVRRRFERERLGVRAAETFESFVALAAPGEWHELARDILAERRHGEDLRCAVAFALGAPSALEVLREHLHLLEEPPRIRWTFHAALLDSACAHGLIGAEVAHLTDADDFALQCSLAAHLAR
jgi:HEAT repeat protein